MGAKAIWAGPLRQAGPLPLGHRKRPFFTLCLPSRQAVLLRKRELVNTHNCLELGAATAQKLRALWTHTRGPAHLQGE